jgi:transcriptional regulator of arginine metabolism
MLNDDIIRLIKEGIGEQGELLKKLEALGHRLTQSSISRRLKQLGVSKLYGKYQLAKASGFKETKISFIQPNLFVIKTAPGHASLIATIIDEQLIENPQFPEFVGSIAGDDTIFLAVDLGDKDSAWAREIIIQLIE